MLGGLPGFLLPGWENFEECAPVLSRKELINTLPSAKKRGLKKHWEGKVKVRKIKDKDKNRKKNK